MKKLILSLVIIFGSTFCYSQEYKVNGTSLVFEIPNELWKLSSDQDSNGKHILTFKREPILDSAGLKIIPNISFITENVGESADVIIYSGQKRLQIPFEVDKVFSHDSENPILNYKNGIGYQGRYNDKSGNLHIIYVLHLINNETGIQVIMDITESLFEEHKNEFIKTISSIRLKK